MRMKEGKRPLLRDQGRWKIGGFLLLWCCQTIALGCQTMGNKPLIAWGMGTKGSSQMAEGPRIGVLDFKDWGYRGLPEELQAWKRALIKELHRDPGWQVTDIPEQHGYQELISQGYRQAMACRDRWKVDLILVAQFYAGSPPTQADIDIYLIDPMGRRSRLIRTHLQPDQKPSAVLSAWEKELIRHLTAMKEASASLFAPGAPAHPHAGPDPDPPSGQPLSWETVGSPRSAPGTHVSLLSPPNGQITTASEVLVEGFASDNPKLGPAIDLFFVLDSSGSLGGAGGILPTDPQDFRSQGAIHLIEKLPGTADIRIGVVDFDGVASLVSPLSRNRAAAIEAIRSLDQDGPTNISGGIDLANAELISHGRRGAAKIEVVFTDGQQPLHDSRFGNDFDPSVIDEAAQAGIVIHTLGLGENISEVDMEKIAQKTGGRFIHVTDPSSLPQAFDHLDPLPSGVEKVILKAEGLKEETHLSLFVGYFGGMVPLKPGPNLIEVQAISRRGEIAVDQILILRKMESERELTIQDPLYQLILSRRIVTPAEGSIELSLDPKHPNRLELKKPPPTRDSIHLNLEIYPK